MTRVKLDTPAFADQSVDTRTIKDGTIIAQDVSGSITNAKLANSSISINGSSVSLGGSLTTNVYLDWQAVTVADGSTTLSAVAGRGYFLDTNTGVIEVFLPTSPSRGDTIALVDYSGTFATNQLIINTGGQLIDSTSGPDFKVTTNNSIVELVYIDANKGWQVILNQAAGTTPDAILTSAGQYDNQFILATGGTVTESGNFKIHTFTGDGNFVVSKIACASANNEVSYLVVAGGGGSGSGGSNCSAGGGGGAGGFRESKSGVDSYTASPKEGSSNITVTATTFPITVGGGGSGGAIPTNNGTSGSNSVFSTITSAGGGGGGSYPGTQPNKDGLDGGSGGGGGCNLSTGGSGNTPPVSPSQGNNGYVIPTAACYQNGAGGGGGGATAVGGQSNAPGGGPTFNGHGGAGGAGASTSISGSSTAYAGGGGGGGNSVAGPASPCGTGGVGAKGSSPGTDAANGTANRGGGAGGGSHKSGQSATGTPVVGKSGGKGIVILRYKFQ